VNERNIKDACKKNALNPDGAADTLKERRGNKTRKLIKATKKKQNKGPFLGFWKFRLTKALKITYRERGREETEQKRVE